MNSIPAPRATLGARKLLLLLAVLGLASMPARAQTPGADDLPVHRSAWAGKNVAVTTDLSHEEASAEPRQLNAANLPSIFITTVAGKGIGDGGAATNATLMQPHGMAFDTNGNLYFADYYDSRIRKISSQGVISTVAGFGATGYTGDGINATNACLNDPTGVAVDAQGDLIIADYFNNRIRKVNSSGVISTVAGNGTEGYSGDGGPAIHASLYLPHAVRVDAAGNLLIADRRNHCIRKVNTLGIITTVAGNGVEAYAGDGGAATNASLNNPFDVAVDASGNLFIADTSNNRIRKVSTRGIIATVAGNGTNAYSGDGGAAINASLHSPEGVAVDAGGNLYIADEDNQRIRKVNAEGIITTVAGNGVWGYSGDGGAATNASLGYPKNVWLDTHGDLFVADGINNRIRKVNAQGVITTIAGQGLNDNGPATNADFAYVFDVAVDAAGDLFIADYGNSRVREVRNGLVFTVAGSGAEGHFGDGGAATKASLYGPTGVAVDAYGDLFIADYENDRVREVDTNGIITTVAGNGTTGYSGDGDVATNATLNGPNAVAVDVYGNLFIADCNNNCVRQVDTNGIITTLAGTGTAGYTGDGGYASNASLSDPLGLATDNFGNVFIADSDNDVVREVDTNGFIHTVAGNDMDGYSGDDGPATDASLRFPTGVAVDRYGDLFIGDDLNQRIRQVDLNGIMTTVAGKGVRGFSGDGGPPANATLSNPAQVAVDAEGNLFIADLINNRVRKVVPATALAPTNQIPQLANHLASQALWAGGNVTFTLGFSGRGPFTYQWLLNSTNLPSDIITTVAGNAGAAGGGGYFGDGGAATNAGLNYPEAAAVDSDGNLYITDTGNNVVRKVNPKGIITTVAGNGTNGYSGDGGPATAAMVNFNYYPSPSGYLAVDDSGNLFISDLGNFRVRKVSAQGIITTVAGNGTQNSPGGGDGGPAIRASFGQLAGLAVDPVGNLYIADVGNLVIRKVNTQGIITTWAGDGGDGYSGDGGPAISASFSSPTGLAVDSATNLLIADAGNNVIRKVNPRGIITTVAGNVLNGGFGGYSGDGGLAVFASLNYPTGLAVDKSDNLFIADGQNFVVRQVDSRGIINTVAGNGNSGYSGDGGPATNAEISEPFDVAVDAAGNLFIPDEGNNVVRKVAGTQFGPSLALTNVTAANAGEYQGVVVGPGGSASSAMANLIVASSPLIYQTTPNPNGSLTLQSVSRPGSTNVVQYATNLSPPVLWHPLGTNTAAASGDWQFTDTNAAHYQSRFYRSLMR